MPTTFSSLDVPAIPDDLVDAVFALARTELVAPNGEFTGFYSGEAPPEQPLPLAVLTEPDEEDEYWTTTNNALASGHLQIAIYAGDRKAARRLGDRIRDLLWDAPLAFAAGRLVYLRPYSRSAMLDPDPGPDGNDCWQEVRIFEYKYSY